MVGKRKFLVIFLFTLVSLLVLTACSQSSANNVTAKTVSVKAQTDGETVSVPVSDVDNFINTRFLLETPTDTLSFMAYEYRDQLYVRADICPPCRSESFTLTKGTLVCDSCRTVFNAETGVGVKGACVKYAKQAADFEVKDGNILIKEADLISAYQNTLYPEKG